MSEDKKPRKWELKEKHMRLNKEQTLQTSDSTANHLSAWLGMARHHLSFRGPEEPEHPAVSHRQLWTKFLTKGRL